MTPTDAQPLAGQAVLITGGARRPGAAMGQALPAAGANTGIHPLTPTPEAATVVAALNGVRESSAIAVQGDLLDTTRLPQLVAATLQKFGRLDILINNASTFYP